MDSVKLNREGYTPIKGTLAQIEGVKDRKAAWLLSAKLAKEGIPNLFNVFIEADSKNSAMNIVQLYQGGLTLGQKEYYLDNDAQTTKVREAFKNTSRRCSHSAVSPMPLQRRKCRR
jgi:putative endopeptidase